MGNQGVKEGSNKASTTKSKADKRKAAKSLSSTSNDLQIPQDLDTSQFNGDENIFIALYDFKSGAENQLSLVKGETMVFLEYNPTQEWAKVTKTNDNSCCGWVPVNHIASAASFFKYPWFHGPLSRNGAEYRLSSGISGSFLVRDSESCPGQLTISLRHEEQYLHYKIQQDSEKIFISETNDFSSLDELIKFYSTEPGLQTCLQYAIPRVNKPTIFDLGPDMEKWEINRSEIEMKQLLGSGQYGDVYEGRLKNRNYSVAVKTLKEDTADLKEFIKEVTIMKEMKHPNLVQLLGICTSEPPFYIITEFLSNGNLLSYLHDNADELKPVILFYMATQIASAMKYLEEKNFIHRDLAARNCLVGEHHLVKVADFGLARLMHDETYTAQAGCRFPIKWTAPEGLAYSTFSTKSDVWAFGVLLWEIATCGQAPYPTLDLGDVYTFLERGNRLLCPDECPDKVYDLMLKCWNWSPAARPTFHEIHDILDNMYQKSDNRDGNVKTASSPTPLVPAQRPETSIPSKTRSEPQPRSTPRISQTTNQQETVKHPNRSNTGKEAAPGKTNQRYPSESNADSEKSISLSRPTKPLLPKPIVLDRSVSASSPSSASATSPVHKPNPSTVMSPITPTETTNWRPTLKNNKKETADESNKLNSPHRQHGHFTSDSNSSCRQDLRKEAITSSTTPLTTEPSAESSELYENVDFKITQSNTTLTKTSALTKQLSEDRSQLNPPKKNANSKPPILKPKPPSIKK